MIHLIHFFFFLQKYFSIQNIIQFYNYLDLLNNKSSYFKSSSSYFYLRRKVLKFILKIIYYLIISKSIPSCLNPLEKNLIGAWSNEQFFSFKNLFSLNKNQCTFIYHTCIGCIGNLFLFLFFFFWENLKRFFNYLIFLPLICCEI